MPLLGPDDLRTAADAARNDALSYGSPGGVHGIIPAVLLLLWRRPQDARACFVLAHGAGPGMTHPFLEAIADGLAVRRVASLRYQFPFMEQGSRRPDQPTLAH